MVAHIAKKLQKYFRSPAPQITINHVGFHYSDMAGLPILLILVMITMMLYSVPSIIRPMRDRGPDNVVRKHTQHVTDADFDKWLHDSFQANDPAFQDACLNILHSRTGSQSQFGQDMFLFFNLFLTWPMTGKRGVYVDSGANDAKELSNTFFFDKCLGWKGLCVEPLPQYHQNLSQHRSCHLHKGCLSSQREMLSMTGGGTGASISNTSSGISVECAPLHELLSDAGLPVHIDLVSLDVEGFEMTVLQSINFSAIHVGAILIEDFWISSRELDMFMSRHGFIKFHQLPVDAVYVNRKNPAPPHVWYPPQFDTWVETNVKFRKEVAAQLKC